MTPQRVPLAVPRAVRQARPSVALVVGLLAGIALAVLAWAPGRAGAQVSCGVGTIATGRVDITHPAAGSTVSGTVSVLGVVTASLPSSSFSHVVLVVDGITVDTYDAPPARQLPFSLTWVAGQSLGSHTLTVSACGALGSHAEGQLTVNVAGTTATTRPAVPHTVVVVPTTTPPPFVTATTSLVGTPTTTVRAVSTTRAEPDRPRDTRPPEEPPPVPDEPAAGLPPGAGRLTLEQAGGRQSSHPALWVGAVVGLPGAAGVAIGAVRRRHAGEEMPPSSSPPEPR